MVNMLTSPLGIAVLELDTGYVLTSQLNNDLYKVAMQSMYAQYMTGVRVCEGVKSLGGPGSVCSLNCSVVAGGGRGSLASDSAHTPDAQAPMEYFVQSLTSPTHAGVTADFALNIRKCPRLAPHHDAPITATNSSSSKSSALKAMAGSNTNSSDSSNNGSNGGSSSGVLSPGAYVLADIRQQYPHIFR